MTLREIVVFVVGLVAGYLLSRVLAARGPRDTGAHAAAVATPAPAVELPDEVRALADDEELIAAIKRMRELTGMGLKEAKDAVDAYRARRQR
jgi:ribosomal protein L7/L12